MLLQDVAKPVFDVAKTELFEKFEKAFIILYLILYSKGVITLLLTGGSTEGDGAGDFDFGILKLFWLINYLITASQALRCKVGRHKRPPCHCGFQ